MKSIPTFSVPQFHSHNLSLHDKKDNEKKENYDNLYEDMIINDDNEDDLPF